MNSDPLDRNQIGSYETSPHAMGHGRPGLPNTVRAILVITGLVFVADLASKGVLDHYLVLRFPAHPKFGIWQVLTSVFMHATIAHILFNMLGLVSFGTPLEQRWGARRFLTFYLACGSGAALTHVAAQEVMFHLHWQRLVDLGVPAAAIQASLDTNREIPGLTVEARTSLVQLYRIYMGGMVGASGAIYGILAAFAVMFPRVRLSLLFLPVPIEARYFIPGLVALDLLSGVTGFSIFGGGIAHFAHIGGAVIGFLIMLRWRRSLG